MRVIVAVANPAAEQTGAVLLRGEGADRAADRPFRGGAGTGVQVGFGQDVGDPEAPAGSQDPGGFGQSARLVDRQGEHAVGDDHVDHTVGQRDVFEVAQPELDVGRTDLGGVRAAQVDHVGARVDAIDVPARPDPAGREQHVQAAAGAEVEHRVAGVQLGHRDRVTARHAGAGLPGVDVWPARLCHRARATRPR
ncbi:hypothetical protein GCM10009613_25320 [Pseudonocardia kongjuensis]|uniref:Uncharacterized protein n=1 Tax=Pseudonocardia kongjuensis TaxID=102227 RepID=A0ABN1XRI9_9PSEU